VHRQIDTAHDERLFYLFGEQALATDFSEQSVLYPVASCADADDLDSPRRGESGVGCGQGTGDKSGLLQGHRAAAGTDAERVREDAHFSDRPCSGNQQRHAVTGTTRSNVAVEKQLPPMVTFPGVHESCSAIA
jgi:hypothetical protein